MNEHIKCNYCGNIADACHVCGDDNPLVAMLAESQARVKDLEDKMGISRDRLRRIYWIATGIYYNVEDMRATIAEFAKQALGDNPTKDTK